ncbi:MAG: helix-turn-helix domain-containing protein [Rugosibacter sp.]|nr:helix-turn-helix domain-containing protein [Rugosibacter sp.]HQN47207.1 helix-turn-helix domain-containing protein [Rugosibacter sp.]
MTKERHHDRRKQVILLSRKEIPVMQIVEHNGLSWYAVNAVIKRYLAEIASAPKPAARGRKAGSGRLLSEAQEATLGKSSAASDRNQGRGSLRCGTESALCNGSNLTATSSCRCATTARNLTRERFNTKLKQAIYIRVPVYTKVKLKVVATAYMQSLEKSSSRMQNRVQKLFRDARVK